MLHHFPYQADDGRWHAVYRAPGGINLYSIGDALTERGARAMAQQANRDQERKAQAAAAAAVHPADRRIPKGLYTDREAD